MKKPVFVRRSLDPSRVAAVEEIAAQAPIVGDPRIGAPASAQPTQAAESQSAASVAPKDSLAAPQDFEHCLCLLKFITNLRMAIPS